MVAIICYNQTHGPSSISHLFRYHYQLNLLNASTLPKRSGLHNTNPILALTTLWAIGHFDDYWALTLAASLSKLTNPTASLLSYNSRYIQYLETNNTRLNPNILPRTITTTRIDRHPPLQTILLYLHTTDYAAITRIRHVAPTLAPS